MQLISHRGFWVGIEEKNSEKAFKRSFEFAYGTETDVRDCCGALVISHDMPDGSEMKFTEFLALYKEYDEDLVLALNVKSDGMQDKIKQALSDFNIASYFMFDMSVPDALQYQKTGLNFFSRISEFEPIDTIIPGSSGVWLDAFESEWYDQSLIDSLLEQGLNVAIVSPELHGRPYEPLWMMLKQTDFDERVILCTDLPDTAKEFFNE